MAFDAPAQALAEMHRVLLPGGRAVICMEVHGEDGREHSHDEQLWETPFYTERAIRDLFVDAGFDQADISYDGEAMVAKGAKALDSTIRVGHAGDMPGGP